jgi:hypothetical protein
VTTLQESVIVLQKFFVLFSDMETMLIELYLENLLDVDNLEYRK